MLRRLKLINLLARGNVPDNNDVLVFVGHADEAAVDGPVYVGDLGLAVEFVLRLDVHAYLLFFALLVGRGGGEARGGVSIRMLLI